VYLVLCLFLISLQGQLQLQSGSQRKILHELCLDLVRFLSFCHVDRYISQQDGIRLLRTKQTGIKAFGDVQYHHKVLEARTKEDTLVRYLQQKKVVLACIFDMHESYR